MTPDYQIGSPSGVADVDYLGLPRMNLDYLGLPWTTPVYTGLTRITQITADYSGSPVWIIKWSSRLSEFFSPQDYGGLQQIILITPDYQFGSASGPADADYLVLPWMNLDYL